MKNTKHKENCSTAFYNERIEKLTIEKNKYVTRARFWVIVRLCTFLAMVASIYLLFPYNWITGIIPIACFVLFLFFVRKSVDNKEKLNFVKALVNINKDEIAAANFDFSAFGDGQEMKDPHHAFSFDMDLFGKGSFFQFFNRTVTKKGEKRLADILLNGSEHRETMAEAVDELSEKATWNQEYLAYGKSLVKEDVDVAIDEAIEEYSLKSWVSICRYVLPVLAFSMFIAYYFDYVSTLYFIVGIVIILAPIRLYITTTRVHKSIVRVGQRVKAMQHQLRILENQQFSSELLANFHRKLFDQSSNGKEGLEKLAKLIKEFEYRDNVLVLLMLNYFFAWDFRLLIKFKQWINEYGENCQNWEAIVYEIEAMISAANYRFNYKEHTCIPVINNNTTTIALKNLGHPLIPLEKLVENDYNLSEEQQFAIVTGPNMAGKSTFLRSVGINLVMARAGFHTFATAFQFPDLKLYSSMRTSDNLVQDTSYFHAELLRLRFIVDAIEKGENVFIILDEILKGTNSKDKEEGSAKFLQKLTQVGAKGIIATHDLSLTALAKNNKKIINLYFDTKIEGDEISFDYTINEGVAQNMNASFLLKKMKLIDA